MLDETLYVRHDPREIVNVIALLVQAVILNTIMHVVLKHDPHFIC